MLLALAVSSDKGRECSLRPWMGSVKILLLIERSNRRTKDSTATLAMAENRHRITFRTICDFCRRHRTLGEAFPRRMGQRFGKIFSRQPGGSRPGDASELGLVWRVRLRR